MVDKLTTAADTDLMRVYLFCCHSYGCDSSCIQGIAQRLDFNSSLHYATPNHQGLHHFLTHSPWSALSLRQGRLELILQVLNGRSIVLIVDDPGDVRKGTTTDYVKRQYIGNIGKLENGIVVVTIYGLIANIPLALTFEVFKPKDCLKPGDEFRTKPQIAGQMVRELVTMGFPVDLVLADRFYGDDYSFSP